MRRVAIALGLALSLLGCGPTGDTGYSPGAVQLLTGTFGCYAGGAGPSEGGVLVPDAEYGVKKEGAGPIRWPEGYAGWRLADGRVEVRNTSGEVVATTGKRYRWTPVPGGGGPQHPQGTDPISICDSYAWDLEEA